MGGYFQMKEKYIYLICLSVFPFMICSGIVYSILSLYIEGLGASRSQIGMVYTFGATSGAITAPFLGKLSDKLGRKTVLIGSMCLFSLVFLGYALCNHYRQLFIVQMGEGMAWAAIGASATAFVADLVPEKRRGWALGMYNTAWNLGWIIGPTLGGFLAEITGFKITFLICVFIMAVGVILGILLLPKKGLISEKG